MDESDLYQEIIDYIFCIGHYLYRNPSGGKRESRFGKKGQYDLSGIIAPFGRRLEIEVKKPKGKLSEDQVKYGNNIRKFGGLAFEAKSLDDVKIFLIEKGYVKDMYRSITGKIKSIAPYEIHLQCNGIEYEIKISELSKNKCHHIKDDIRIFTHLDHKETEVVLYGFISLSERSVFRKLIKIKKIGCMTAIKILSGIDCGDFDSIIKEKNLDAFSDIKGIGKKLVEEIMKGYKT